MSGLAGAAAAGNTGFDGAQAMVAGEVHLFPRPVKVGTPALCSAVLPGPGFKQVFYPTASGLQAYAVAHPGPAPICMDCWREAGWRP